MSFSRGSRALRLATLGLLVLGAGCRNPFDPESDVVLREIRWFDPTLSANWPEVRILQNQTTAPINFTIWRVDFVFTVRNKVAVNINRVNIEYTDLFGNPVTVYKDFGGRNFTLLARLEPMQFPGQVFPSGIGNDSIVSLFLVDQNVIDEITSPSYPSHKTMFATVTFFGEDVNGYDFRRTGQIPIKGFGT